MEPVQRIGKRLRQLRQGRGWTLKDLSEASGLSVSFISQIECGTASMTLTSLQRIAEGLGVSLETLFQPPLGRARVTRSFEHSTFEIEKGDVVYAGLSNTGIVDRCLEPFLVTLLPSERWENVQPYSHPGEEFGFILEGTLTVVFEDSHVDLGPGDSIHLESSTPHNWQNRTDRPARALWVITPRVFS